jgi:hypothetical protein
MAIGRSATIVHLVAWAWGFVADWRIQTGHQYRSESGGEGGHPKMILA